MRIRSRFLHKIAGAMLGSFTRLLASTVKFRSHGESLAPHPLLPDCPRTYIVATWHDTMLMPIMLRRLIHDKTPNNRMTTLVSLHQDGSFLTYAMKYFDLGTVRGSTNRGGTAALKSLIDEVQLQHICMTPDGPRGPRRVISQGIIALASMSQVPIIPCAFMASRYWRFKGSWTDLILPKPFSTIYAVMGQPFHVPPDLSKAEIEEYRQKMQLEMDRLEPMVESITKGEVPSTLAKPIRRAA